MVDIEELKEYVKDNVEHINEIKKNFVRMFSDET